MSTKEKKYNTKGVRGVLVNLDLELAEQFYALSRQSGKSASKKAKELIDQFVKDNTQVTPTLPKIIEHQD